LKRDDEWRGKQAEWGKGGNTIINMIEVPSSCISPPFIMPFLLFSFCKLHIVLYNVLPIKILPSNSSVTFAKMNEKDK
jgi:hypothetical protein